MTELQALKTEVAILKDTVSQLKTKVAELDKKVFPELLTQLQFAEATGYDRIAIYRFVKAGRLAQHFDELGRVRYHRDDVPKFTKKVKSKMKDFETE